MKEPGHPFIAIRTCDRPGYLRRLLLSVARRRSPNPATVLVFDDSRDEAAAGANQQAVASARKRFGLDARYLGHEWQQAFMQALRNHAPGTAASIQWLLAGRAGDVFTGGRLLNFAMLALAGQRFTLFDDDYLLDRARHLGQGLNRELGWSRDPPRQVLGHSSVRESREAGQELPIDPVDEHLKFLGRRLQDCLRPGARGEAPLLDASNAGEPPQRLQLDADSEILTIVNGQYGVPIAPNSFYLFHQLQGEAGPVWADPGHYRILRQGKAVWNVTFKPIVAGRTGSTPSAIDNRRMMPPTLPLCRGEDSLFCAMVKYLYPNAAHLYLPWALEHSRKPRALVRATFEEPQKILLGKVFWKKAEDLADQIGNGGSAEERLQQMAAYWQDWAGQPYLRRREEIASAYLRGVRWRIRITRECLEWLDAQAGERSVDDDGLARKDLRRALRRFETDERMAGGLPELADAPGIQEEQERIDWLAGVGRDFSRALQAWTRLWEAARKMQPLG